MSREPDGQLVEREFLTLSVWDQLDAQTAETVARAIERCLPEPWTFLRLAWHECGGQKRHVAFFDWDEIEFALIPGGEFTLGYDSSRPLPPTSLLDPWYEQAREWAEHSPESADITWKRYLAEMLSPPRQVQLAPLLIAVRGAEKLYPTGGEERNALAADGGFALPTADEWEFACSAGSRSVWYWGDDPTSDKPEANAFGLVIARNTYHQEALDQTGHYRGGDGGVRVHGGACELESFVPLSSWFWNTAEPDQEDWWEYTRYRRVYRLPDAMFG